MSTRATHFPTAATSPLGRSNIGRIALGQFVGVVLVLTLWAVLEKFLGARSALAFAVLGLPLLALSTLAIMVWAAWPIRWPKVVVLVLAVVADIALISGHATLSRAGDRLFFETRRSKLEALARDIRAYGRIRQMNDGARAFTELNCELVAAVGNASPATAPAPRHPIEQVLARDDIAASRYDEFRRRLHDLKITQFDAKPGFVAFLYDGMLDELEGYLLVQPGGSPPAVRSPLFGASVIRVEPLGDGWYRFATT